MKSFIWLFVLFTVIAVQPVRAMNTEQFLETDQAKMRNTRSTAFQLLAMISNKMAERPDWDEVNWLHAAMLYFIGDYYETLFEKKKQLFTMTKDYSLKAVRLNDESADAHYWLSVGYAKWSEANGILDSLFYADDILEELNKTIAIRPSLFYGIAWAIRAKVYDFAPGWPLSVGNKERAYQDIRKALEYGPGFRFNYQIYAEILINDGMFEEALKIIEQGLALPLDPMYPREEEKITSELKKDLVIVKNRLGLP